MFLIDLLLIFVFALIFTSILTYGFRWRHPAGGPAAGASALFLFVILLLGMWAAAVWLPPFGPLLFGTSWLGFFFIGLFIALIVLAAATPTRLPRSPREAVEEAEEAEAAAVIGTVFGVFFWILIVALLVGIVLSFFTQPELPPPAG